jgi:hypothetical protein
LYTAPTTCHYMYCGESCWWSAALPNGCAVGVSDGLKRSHGIFIMASRLEYMAA